MRKLQAKRSAIILEQAGLSTRRTFLKTLGAGLLIAVSAPVSHAQEAPASRPGRGGRGRRGGGGGPIDIAARVHIGQDGTITVMTGKVECGQGARGEITQAAAEELRVPVGRIQLIMADTALVPDDGGTYGTQTTPRTLPVIRQGAAGARAILISLAAAKWGVTSNELQAMDGKVVHAASGREADYSELAGGDSAKVFAATRPSGVNVTSVAQWKVMGTPKARNDARSLVDGTHQYPTDIVRPAMLYGKVLRPPSYGAKLTKIDVSVAKAMKDVIVVQDGDFTGVAAPTSFLARQAIEALAKTAKWDEHPQVSSTAVYDHLRTNARGVAVKNPLDADLQSAHQALRRTYRVAYAQHAPMEPRAAVAEWSDGKLTVWTGSQNPFGVRGELQTAFGLTPQTARVIIPDFGGKHTGECAVEAARLAKGTGRPVWLRYTREEEFMWAYFRPSAVILAEAGLDAGGALSSWYFVNINSGNAGLNTPYQVAGKHEQYAQSDPPLRQGSYRGLAATANHFARDSFTDELAAAAGSDPLAFRLKHLDDPPLIAVLKTAADRFDFTNLWNSKHPGVGVGLACGTEKGSYLATCAEVAIDEQTQTISVRRACQVFECGKIVNPSGLLSQVQGSLMMGIGPALREEVKFENGRVTNGTFSDYLVSRFADMPEIDVQLLDRPDIAPAGAGETAIMGIAPAIGNAVFHATGKRIRQMPIRLDAAVA